MRDGLPQSFDVLSLLIVQLIVDFILLSLHFGIHFKSVHFPHRHGYILGGRTTITITFFVPRVRRLLFLKRAAKC